MAGAALPTPNFDLGKQQRSQDLIKRNEEAAAAAAAAQQQQTRDAGLDPQYNLQQEAKQYRAEIPQEIQRQYEPIAGQGRRQLAENLSTIKRSSNQRGLLFSGLRQGAEADTRANIASTLAGQRAEIGADVSRLADSRDAASANYGLAGYQDALAKSQRDYELNQENDARRRLAMAQLGQGLGYGFGAYYGSQPGRAAPINFTDAEGSYIGRGAK